MSDPRKFIDPKQVTVKFPGAAEAWGKTKRDRNAWHDAHNMNADEEDDRMEDASPYISAHDGNLRATDLSGGTYGWDGKAWICPECGTTPDGKNPSVQCHFCNRGPKGSMKNEMGSGAGGVAGVQLPLGIQKRKKKVQELLAKNKDITEVASDSYFATMGDEAGEELGSRLDRDDPSIADEIRQHAVRELIRHKVREVVRKKAGGGGYTLYAPNPGKKGGSKPVGSFPTKLGAKRAELARFPPRDPAKLKRLRKDIERTSKDPKKAAEKEKTAAKQRGTDKGGKKKHESVNLSEAGPFTPSSTVPTTSTTPTSAPGKVNISKDLPTFMQNFKAIPKEKAAERQNFVSTHLADTGFTSKVRSSTNGAAALKSLYSIVDPKTPTGAFKPGQVNVKTNKDNTNPGITSMNKPANKPMGEAIERRMDHMHRSVLAKIVTRSLVESLFREEKTESEWDDYIGKLSKQALAGDTKFQSLQKNINKKTEGILNDAFNSIRKAVGKDVKLKSFGVKHDAASGQTYMAFSAEFDDVTAEPFYIHVEGGVPRIEVSANAKVALTKTDPDAAKLFRAELVTVQERVLDEMDDLAVAIHNRDKYLTKLENEVDSYVSGLAPLQISLLKQLLVKKYRKIT